MPEASLQQALAFPPLQFMEVMKSPLNLLAWVM